MVNKNSSKVCRIACLSKGLDGSDESRHRDDDSGSFGMEDFLFFFFLEFFERFYDRVDRARGVSRGLSILIFRFRFRLER